MEVDYTHSPHPLPYCLAGISKDAQYLHWKLDQAYWVLRCFVEIDPNGAYLRGSRVIIRKIRANSTRFGGVTPTLHTLLLGREGLAPPNPAQL